MYCLMLEIDILANMKGHIEYKHYTNSHMHTYMKLLINTSLQKH